MMSEVMGESSEAKPQFQSQPPQLPPPPPPIAPPPVAAAGGGGVSDNDILRREKREDLVKKSLLGLRIMALLFSFVGFVVMASNSHGYGLDYNNFGEYRYILAVTIISTLYTMGQVCRQVQEMCTGKDLLQPKTMTFIDFVGDQMMAYVLVSAASSGVPNTNGLSNLIDRGEIIKLDLFVDFSAAAIGMSFMAFICLALSALLSVYKLSTYVPLYI